MGVGVWGNGSGCGGWRSVLSGFVGMMCGTVCVREGRSGEGEGVGATGTRQRAAVDACNKVQQAQHAPAATPAASCNPRLQQPPRQQPRRPPLDCVDLAAAKRVLLQAYRQRARRQRDGWGEAPRAPSLLRAAAQNLQRRDRNAPSEFELPSSHAPSEEEESIASGGAASPPARACPPPTPERDRPPPPMRGWGAG